MVLVQPEKKTAVEKPTRLSTHVVSSITRHFSADSHALSQILHQKSESPAWKLSSSQLEVYLRSELIFKQVKHKLPEDYTLALIDKASNKRKRIAVIVKLIPQKPPAQAARPAGARGAVAARPAQIV